jgi:hypothetical protein
MGPLTGHRTAAVCRSRRLRDARISVLSGPMETRHMPRRTWLEPCVEGTEKSSVPSGSVTVADAPGARSGVRSKPRSALSGKPLVPWEGGTGERTQQAGRARA